MLARRLTTNLLDMTRAARVPQHTISNVRVIEGGPVSCSPLVKRLGTEPYNSIDTSVQRACVACRLGMRGEHDR